MNMRVLLVSDVHVVQEGVRSVLAHQYGLDVVSVVDRIHAREESERLAPDVVLLDAAREDSIDFVRTLVVSLPHSRVVAFGARETEQEILALAAAGTAGYVRESAQGGDVVRVLERVMRDELTCSARAAASLYHHVATLVQGGAQGTDATPAGQCARSDPGAPLSPRQRQIAQLIAWGLTNKQIGRHLGIEAATVKNHVHNICEKLRVHRRGEVTARMRAALHVRTASAHAS